MNLMTMITDNVTEILVKVIEFTQARQRILAQNIINLNTAGFVPRDLEVDEFSKLMNYAVSEHIRNQRLIFCDTENIKFGRIAGLDVRPITDETGIEILERNQDEYIELQIKRLLENSLNQRIATELLKQIQE